MRSGDPRLSTSHDCRRRAAPSAFSCMHTSAQYLSSPAYTAQGQTGCLDANRRRMAAARTCHRSTSNRSCLLPDLLPAARSEHWNLAWFFLACFEGDVYAHVSVLVLPRIEIAEKVYCRRSQPVAGRGELFIAIMATMDRLEAMRLFVRVA